MNDSRFALATFGIAIGLFAVLILMLEIGRRLGIKKAEKHGADARTGVGVVDSAVYGLLALLIGFSFNGAANRFDSRRSIVATQVNTIGTAWQRLDLLPPESQGEIRDAFRRYVDTLLASFADNQQDLTTVLLEPPALRRAADDLWGRAVAACITPPGEKARMLVLPALNEAFGVVESERLARRIHPPSMIFVMLALTASAAALFAGYGIANKSTRNWLFMIGVAATISVAVFVIIELEYPRLGLVRIDEMDRALLELRTTMR